MIRSAIAAMFAAALAAVPAAAQTQGQPQTPAPNYPYQKAEPPPARDVIRDVVQDTLDAAARARAERRVRERERRERERLEWELRQQQQQQLPPPDWEPPVAVAPPLPEPSSPPDPAFDPEPRPTPETRPATPKPVPAAPLATSPPAKPAPAPDRPISAMPPVVPERAPPSLGDPAPVAPAVAPGPPTTPWVTTPETPADPEPSPLSRWWPLALLGLGVAAAGGGWSVQQRRARIARTKALLSLEPRLDQQAGTSSTSPINLAAPRVSIRTRLEYS